MAGTRPSGPGTGWDSGRLVGEDIGDPVVLARVATQLVAKRARDWLKDQNAILEAEVARRMVENDLTQRVSIRALAHLADTRLRSDFHGSDSSGAEGSGGDGVDPAGGGCGLALGARRGSDGVSTRRKKQKTSQL